jgi:hypothetical protein
VVLLRHGEVGKRSWMTGVEAVGVARGARVSLNNGWGF